MRCGAEEAESVWNRIGKLKTNLSFIYSIVYILFHHIKSKIYKSRQKLIGKT